MVVWTGTPIESSRETERRVSKQFCRRVALTILLYCVYVRAYQTVSARSLYIPYTSNIQLMLLVSRGVTFLICVSVRGYRICPRLWNQANECAVLVCVNITAVEIRPFERFERKQQDGGGWNKRVLRLRLILNRAWLGCAIDTSTVYECELNRNGSDTVLFRIERNMYMEWRKKGACDKGSKMFCLMHKVALVLCSKWQIKSNSL